MIVLLAIVILSVSTIRRPFQKSNARKALRGFAFFAIFLAFITPLFGSEEEYNPTRVEKRILAEERKKATSSPQEYTEPINQIHYLTEKKKRADHTVIKKTETGTFVSIDGSNGYFQNPDRPLGHDTGIVVNPGETIKVGYVSGHLTYNCYGHGSRDRIWEGYNFEKAKWEAGERIRYKRPYSGHSVFVILKTDSKEKADYYKNGRREVVLTNDLSGKARVYLLYNIYKKFLSRKHMLADGFPRAACERSMMKFFIKKE